ncbi:MAG: tetratricopeptide repeat protein [Bacteroidales bacterium]|nr:tetratricopeptide repeat protein [Bacteroidales bacterium]
MKQDINYSRYVDRYLENVMSKEELIWFEKELEGNSDLKAEVELQRTLHLAIADTETLELQEQLDDIYIANYQPWKKALNIHAGKKKRTFFTAGIAASVAISVVLVLNVFKSNVTAGDLVNQYYKPAEISMSFRAKGEENDNNIRQAMIYYENKNYIEAIALFEKILKEDDSRIGLNLYSGISNMEIREYEKANDNFQKVIDHQTNAFIESANWYLGLCYLMTDDVEKARQIFTAISDEKGHYAKNARKILRKL